MKTKIIVDSTVDLNPAVRERVAVVPLTVHFGEEEFVDGVTIDHKAFYEKLIECDTLPVTSQATPDAFGKEFAKLAEDEAAVVLTVASKHSGTCQSAHIAAEDYPGKVFIVDSQSVALGSGILAERALQLADQGLEAKAIAEQLELEREDVRLIALVDTLEYLKKGGRISKTAAVAGSLLSIKPVLSVQDGEIVMLGKARGSKQGNNLLVKEIEASGGVDFSRPVLLGYTGLSDHMLKKYIEDSDHLWKEHVQELNYTVVGSVVGTHAGPGAIAAAFFKK
ncbi:MAG: DegV family protein [Clostridia bacterium]|nr:DegV family protein [Clostridia bacterium]